MRGKFVKAVLCLNAVLLCLCLLQYLYCLDHSKAEEIQDRNKKTIFVITPTYQRPEQLAELTRVGQTFASDGGIHWIVVEDAEVPSPVVEALLFRLKPKLLGFTHLNLGTPLEEKLQRYEARWKKVRGVHQRNAGLTWLRKTQKDLPSTNSPVVYFADDDNTYDVRLFDKIRNVKKIGVWPVGLVGKILYEGPICDVSKSHVLQWRTNWRPDRFCACDMSGFAVSLSLILKHPEVLFSSSPGIGMLESDFLSRFVSSSHVTRPSGSQSLRLLEPIVCDEILVWHTRTKSSDLTAENEVNSKFPINLVV